MKKIISLALALVLVVFAFAACKNDEDTPSASTPKDKVESTPEKDIVTPTEPQDEIEFAPCDETVYTTVSLRLRTSADFEVDDNIAMTVNPGTELNRIGYHETYSKVIYEGKEYFCGTNYLTTEIPAESSGLGNSTPTDDEFDPCNDTVYVSTGFADGSAHIYSKADRSTMINDKVLAEGTALTRTGVYYESETDPTYGWTRFTLDGETYYIRNSQVSTTAPGEPEASETPAASENN